MKTFLKILGALVGLVVLLVAGLVVFVLMTLKPSLPGDTFALQPLPAGGERNIIVFGATGKLGSEIVEELRDRGATVVLSSHALTEIEERTERVIIMNRGVKTADGS
ncbi:MAG: hypothetical protein L6Q83_04375, partial [Gammaproteobacteria bacterium]|nr:hypothetical protein [Gammaproteobacteria bacterium]